MRTRILWRDDVPTAVIETKKKKNNGNGCRCDELGLRAWTTEPPSPSSAHFHLVPYTELTAKIKTNQPIRPKRVLPL